MWDKDFCGMVLLRRCCSADLLAAVVCVVLAERGQRKHIFSFYVPLPNHHSFAVILYNLNRYYYENSADGELIVLLSIHMNISTLLYHAAASY
jgi:hypothetical protein